MWTGAEAKECIESILPYVDIFFCSEDTARLTFLKEGDAKSIMKSFTEEYPISIVASTQRIVHSPKRHTFGSIIYSAKDDTYYEEAPYTDIEVVDASEAVTLISPVSCTDCWHIPVSIREHWNMAMPSAHLRTPSPVTCCAPT